LTRIGCCNSWKSFVDAEMAHANMLPAPRPARAGQLFVTINSDFKTKPTLAQFLGGYDMYE